MTDRICMFMADFTGGGSERVMVNIANGLASREYDVDFVVARAEGPYRETLRTAVNVLPLSRYLSLSLLPFMKYLRRTRPVCILAAGEHACIVAILARMLSGTETRLTVSMHGSVHRPRGGWSGRYKTAIDGILVKIMYRHADCVVTVTEGLRTEAIEDFGVQPSKAVTIYNPVYEPVIDELAREPVAHSWLSATNRMSPVLIAVGRLNPEKGLDILVRALALVRRHREVQLIILGEGSELGALRRLSEDLNLNDYIDFMGFVANPYSYIARSDILVLPSRSEGFGNVLVEALAVGTPVVAADCKYGPREILDGGIYGTLVRPNDPDALARGILSALNATPSKDHLRQRAKQFAIDDVIDRYEDTGLALSVGSHQ